MIERCSRAKAFYRDVFWTAAGACGRSLREFLVSLQMYHFINEPNEDKIIGRVFLSNSVLSYTESFMVVCLKHWIFSTKYFTR